MTFTTFDEDEATADEVTAVPGQREWLLFSQSLQLPWFHVTTLGDGIYTTLFLASLEHLLLSWQTLPTSISVEAIRLVSPKWLNGKGDWLMEPLSQVLVGTEPTTDQVAKVYILRDGSRYVESDLRTPLSNLRELRVVLNFPSRIPHTRPLRKQAH